MLSARVLTCILPRRYRGSRRSLCPPCQRQLFPAHLRGQQLRAAPYIPDIYTRAAAPSPHHTPALPLPSPPPYPGQGFIFICVSCDFCLLHTGPDSLMATYFLVPYAFSSAWTLSFGLRELKPRIFVLLAVELWEIARLLCASVTPNVTGEWN